MNKITLKLLIIQMMFLSILTVNATDIKYEMNPDGSFKALYAVYPSGNVKIKMSMNPDGTYKAIYIQPIGNVYTDLIQALSDEDAKIRYNPETDKWQWTIDGTNWVDFSEGGASDILGGKNSISKTDDGYLELVNDLTDTELEIQGKDLVYGYSVMSKARGWKEDLGGKVGTKEVDETDIEDGKVLVYNKENNKLVYRSIVSGNGFISFPYAVWRKVFENSFTGYLEIEIQVASDKGFTVILLDTTSEEEMTYFKYFSATNGIYQDWENDGVPATDVLDVVYLGSLNFEKPLYVRWRGYEHGNSDNASEWIPAGVLK